MDFLLKLQGPTPKVKSQKKKRKKWKQYKLEEAAEPPAEESQINQLIRELDYKEP